MFRWGSLKDNEIDSPLVAAAFCIAGEFETVLTYFVHSKMLGWINTFIRLNKISILNKIRERDFLIRNIIYTLCILLNPDVLKIMREISR